MKGIDRNDDTDRLLQVDKALFIKETAISLLLEVKLFPFWNLVPDDVGDEGQISTAPHRRTYDTEESPVEEEGEPGVGVVGAGFDVDFPGGYGIGYILENPIKFASPSENTIEKWFTRSWLDLKRLFIYLLFDDKLCNAVAH